MGGGEVSGLKTVQISNNKQVVVRELDVDGVRTIVSSLGDVSDFTLSDLLGDKFDVILVMADTSITMPEGVTFGKLALSDALQVYEAFKEVNPDFFKMAGMLAKLAQFPAEILEEISTGQPAT